MSSRSALDGDVLLELVRIVKGGEESALPTHISRITARLLGSGQAATSLHGRVGVHADGGGEPDEALRAAAAEDAPAPPGMLRAPLTSGDRERIGAIVIPGSLEGDQGPEQEGSLHALAQAVSAALDQRRILMELEEAQRQRQAFFGVVSHELRTPITTIYGGTRVLRRTESRMSYEARRQLLDDVAEEAERLYRLVEDLLVLSRAERESVVVAAEPILLQHLVARVVESERRHWPRAVIQVRAAPGLPPVMGDSTLVEQVIRNLLSNAVKYAAAGGPIEVSTLAREGWVEVRVEDRGPGVDRREPERVFELFYREPEAPARAQGAGIGLFVCRTLVEAMGGDVWVRPRDPSGAEFGFRLRAYEADAPGSEPSLALDADDRFGAEPRRVA